MQNQPYALYLPAERCTSVVFASPHSGRAYERSFLRSTLLDQWQIRSSEDAFVDMLFADVPQFGAPFLVANAPRAYVDLNRGAEELDPALVRGVRRQALNARIASGLGVIPRVVAGARPIYHGKISLSEAQQRLSAVWFPYHDQLQRLLDDCHRQFGQAVLIDCHSMPHEAVRNVTYKGVRPDIVLGDRYGAAASAGIVKLVASAFEAQGFSVALNTPFAGAYMAQHYGRPTYHQHVVQVEIDRALYMNEGMVRPNGQFDQVRTRLTKVAQDICQIGCSEERLAAE
ncbi:N-formylglutamate amidohydrolase [Aliiroseovarius crassostreae]|uniref:N-formylglutamate amidohydrolase n=1 Tax=Aliiroseovarius crassostreae TaxID=154981 RepID=A0A9Q9LYU7_9RHOB|nr:N-formylglutamate amidohydrolase [Aliiroseovarius crassostreae]UWP88645.1 N-formylglutamate amidohydrolase [Aliiroseovarius crassostreae]UWP94954.1 N-formylglutamate amidohydrolase [Aliiroseovarius crassostreae]UWP98114.1 N-formylglutamate amidohydrolase [Aliiroseovarius crassostreae]